MSLVAPRGVAAEPVDQGQARLEALLFKVGVKYAGMRIRFWSKTGSGALHFKLREIFKKSIELIL